MPYYFKKSVITALSLIAFLLFSPDCRADRELDDLSLGESHSSTSMYIDASADQTAYGQQVAQLNKAAERTGLLMLPQSPNRTSETRPRYAVLCRTDGQPFDFAAVSPVYTVAGPHDCYTLFFSSETAADQAVEKLSQTQGIRYAERDAEVTACGESEYSFSSWGAVEMNYRDYMSYTSQWGNGAATVAIIDSGVYLHSQLAGRILASGYDYIDADDDATNDPFGHGTNVAGIVADCTALVPVYLYPIRVLNANGGGKISNVTNAVREATEKGVDVINLSLESTILSAALDDAILDAVGAGITVVTAAGNKSMDTAQVSPAHLSNMGVIVVGAAEKGGGRSSYSNYGESVDVYAYGSSIRCCSRTGGYALSTGTSMAAPHISGLAAMLRLLHPGISPLSVEGRIVSATDSTLEANVPDLRLMIPERPGFCLSLLRMDRGETWQLPQKALPETAMESISYTSSDETVLRIEDGKLAPVQAGSVSVTASCFGLESTSFEVRIEDFGGVKLTLPDNLSCIEDEAFRGDTGIQYVVVGEKTEALGESVFEDCENLRILVLPESLTLIGSNTFSNAVVLCPEGSYADQFAQENALSYVIEKP